MGASHRERAALNENIWRFLYSNKRGFHPKTNAGRMSSYGSTTKRAFPQSLLFSSARSARDRMEDVSTYILLSFKNHPGFSALESADKRSALPSCGGRKEEKEKNEGISCSSERQPPSFVLFSALRLYPLRPVPRIGNAAHGFLGIFMRAERRQAEIAFTARPEPHAGSPHDAEAVQEHFKKSP